MTYIKQYERKYSVETHPPEWEDIPDRYYYDLPAWAAGPGHLSSNGIRVSAIYHYNGSGKESFGGADKWPVIRVIFSLPEGRTETRDKIAIELTEFCEELQKKYGVEVPKDTAKC